MLLTGLLVDNAYGGGLASTYTVPRFEKSTDTVQALIDSPMNWGATHDAWIFSLLLSTDVSFDIRSIISYQNFDHTKF